MWKRKFIAFIAVGLLLISGRLYANGLSRYAFLGDYFSGEQLARGNLLTLCRGYDRLELESEADARAVITHLSAREVMVERAGDAEIYYYFSPNLIRSVTLYGKKINLVIAFRAGKAVAGTPLLLGSY